MTVDDRPRTHPEEVAAISTFLGPLRGRTLLDLGCADPAIARLAARGVVHDYHGLAAAEPLRAAAGAEVPGAVELFDPDRWAGAGAGRYDLVVAARTLQHTRNLARLLETLYHHVSPGGRLVFSIGHPFDCGDDYFAEGERDDGSAWFGRPRYHRTFAGYVRELGYCGFRVVELAEGGRPGGNHPGPPRWTVFRCARGR